MPCSNRFRAIEFTALRGKVKLAAATMAALFAFVWVGCAKIQPPLYRYGPDGERVLFKRVPKNIGVDLFVRADRKAYEPGTHFVADHLSEQQTETYDAYGHPQHVRRPFESREGEKVDEWVYPRHNYMAQWIQGRKVYEGEMSDIEATLLRHGYPRKAFYFNDEYGLELQRWIYQRDDVSAFEVIAFTDGKMVFKTGN